MRIATSLLAAAVAAAWLPHAASAHVGRTLPVATDFTARVTAGVPPLSAKVVDGDQTLWLHAPASVVVRVPGTLGEPLLRFDARGVWLNLRSVTAQADRIDRFDLRPSADPEAAPRWHRLTSGHAYAWHEHRLHALEPLARGRHTAGVVGRWSVPLVVGGRPARLEGLLDYRPSGRTWAWIVATAAVALLSGAAALRWPAALAGSALVMTAWTWTLRVGRELYGRPDVATVGWVEVALTCAVGAALVYGLTRRDEGTRIATAFFAGFGGVYQGLTMLALLTHAIGLTALPSTVARVGEVLVLGLAPGVLATTIFGRLGADAEPEPA